MSVAGKKSQGTLAEEALQQYGDTSSHDLIDIGINLADPSFDQVTAVQGSIIFTDTTLKASDCPAYFLCPPTCAQIGQNRDCNRSGVYKLELA